MIAVYAGTFDPVTAGHSSVVAAAARLFAHVRVLVAVNPDKRPLFPVDERVALLRAVLGRLPNVSVDATEGLIVDYAREIGAGVMVRGVRGATDAAFETDLAARNRSLAPDVATVLLPADPRVADVSSSALKQAAARGEDVARFCAPVVARALRERLGADEGAAGARS